MTQTQQTIVAKTDCYAQKASLNRASGAPFISTNEAVTTELLRHSPKSVSEIVLRTEIQLNTLLFHGTKLFLSVFHLIQPQAVYPHYWHSLTDFRETWHQNHAISPSQYKSNKAAVPNSEVAATVLCGKNCTTFINRANRWILNCLYKSQTEQ
jgi:hypothetical protein